MYILTPSEHCHKSHNVSYRGKHTTFWHKLKRGESMYILLDSSWNVMAHGDAREGKWRGNWRMKWVASTLTLPRNMVFPALLTLMRTTRLPAVDWTDTPADLNGLVRFAERRNLVSARAPSHFKRILPLHVESTNEPFQTEPWEFTAVSFSDLV